MLLNLNKPLVFFDLETTGVNVGMDHIVEICLYKVNPDQSTETLVQRLRPVDKNGETMHIPEVTTAIHGISDADVADKPTFGEMAATIAEFIGDADLAGYNSNKFDVPLLVEEFLRQGYPFSLDGRRLIDVQNIFHKMEQRTLKAAYRFYCGKNLDNAHSADADTMATYEVLMAQMERYTDLPATVKELSDYLAGDKRMADFAGRILYDQQGKEIFNFGKYKGQRVIDVFRRDRGYYSWLLDGDFPEYTKSVFKRIYLSL